MQQGSICEGWEGGLVRQAPRRERSATQLIGNFSCPLVPGKEKRPTGSSFPNGTEIEESSRGSAPRVYPTGLHSENPRSQVEDKSRTPEFASDLTVYQMRTLSSSWVQPGLRISYCSTTWWCCSTSKTQEDRISQLVPRLAKHKNEVKTLQMLLRQSSTSRAAISGSCRNQAAWDQGLSPASTAAQEQGLPQEELALKLDKATATDRK
nr:uncharacterized protein LOC129163953 [Nothobranchius furzeri]